MNIKTEVTLPMLHKYLRKPALLFITSLSIVGCNTLLFPLNLVLYAVTGAGDRAPSAGSFEPLIQSENVIPVSPDTNPLSLLHFVFSYDAHAQIELIEVSVLSKTHQSELEKLLVETDWEFFAPVTFSDELTKELHEKGFSLERPFSIYEPVKKEFFDYELTSFALFPSGDGGVSGVAGILSPVKDETPDLPAGGTTIPTAVGYWNDSSERIQVKPDHSSPHINSELLLESVSQGREVISTKIWTNENGPFLLLTEREKNTQRETARLIFYHDGTLTPIRYSEDDSFYFVLHDPMGEKDGSPWKGSAYFLPDLDQNGYPEVFIKNTVSSIYELKTYQSDDNIKIEKVKDIYYGP